MYVGVTLVGSSVELCCIRSVRLQNNYFSPILWTQLKFDPILTITEKYIGSFQLKKKKNMLFGIALQNNKCSSLLSDLNQMGHNMNSYS